MTFNVSVKSNIKEATRNLTAIQRKIIPVATVSALNKVARQVRTESVRELSKVKKLKQKDIRPRFKLVKATRITRAAQVQVRAGGGVRAIDVGNARQTKYGVNIGSRYKFKSAFLARMPSGHRGVFRRVRKSRLPIREVRIPLSPAAEQITQKHAAVLVRTRFPKLFNHELDWRLKRKGLR